MQQITSSDIAVLDTPYHEIHEGWRPPGTDKVLDEIGSIILTERGALFTSNTPSRIDLLRTDRMAGRMLAASKWIIADVARYVIWYGPEYQDIIDHYDIRYIYNLAWVARAWPHDQRWPSMSMSHHQILAPLMLKARNLEEVGKVEEARWYELLAHTWMRDSAALDWRRHEFREQVKNYTLPPSMREPDDPLQLGEPMELIVTDYDPTYTIVELREAVISLIDWAKNNDCPEPLLRKVMEILKVDR